MRAVLTREHFPAVEAVVGRDGTAQKFLAVREHARAGSEALAEPFLALLAQQRCLHAKVVVE